MSNIDKQAVQAVADLKAGYTLGHADVAILNELARIALASLEAGPVAWAHRLINKRNGVVHPWVYGSAETSPSEGDIFNIEVMPLYTAPPAPVSVPDAMEMDDDFDSAFEHGKAVGWNACRAAMLQGANGTLTNEGTITATQFKPVADLYGLTSPTGGETSFTFDAVEARDFIDGGWSCQEYVELGRFQEAVSGNSPVIPGCSCLTCRPLTFSDSRFVVCPECGNKRCPHANDHRNACTGSNEPGQEGSAYPAAPQQEVESQIRKGKTVAMEEWELGARLTKHRFKP
ncbi:MULTISPECIES: hypothetical protein [Enterobacter cloacae complex]|uniref:hypothetical protein n=1 Tax=Enterobacter cloacae complex TaxID=354276 RepID=UPI000452635A|nr:MULTISPECIES: hypothetical protein [Enterobacter cloacae complex]EUM82293.1 hypothetical protein L353_06034 [Enterobacter sp. MGH 7]KJF33450.1 hypothetical protein L469_00770 [Enterobacter hormaechei]MDE7576690.1 hypothetical protein [Enterobacter hormaechei]MDE7585739.1 hypothetical protein [Enterobacter hormaechei]MDE7594945.1 hypothetical protein [Enterobacter hormaechei]